MSKIIDGLKQAVRYSRGDKRVGTSTIVNVPNALPSYETLVEMAKAGHGEWVNIEDMDPMSNVSGRVFATADGLVSVWCGPTNLIPAAWFYPRMQN